MAERHTRRHIGAGMEADFGLRQVSLPSMNLVGFELSPNYRLDRYRGLKPLGGCARCSGPIITGSCLNCGYAGPTRVATEADWPGRPVQTSKHIRTRMPRHA